jgi:hypothetical protein
MAAAAGLVCSATSRDEQDLDWMRGAMSIESPHDALRWRLVPQLARFADASVSAELMRLAGSETTHPSTAAACCEALADRKPVSEEVRELLQALVDHTSPRVRLAAIRGLGSLDHPDVPPVLAQAHGRCRFARERLAVEEALERMSSAASAPAAIPMK